jgi:hypothetical protein
MIEWNRVFPVWWSFFWRASIYGLVGGSVLGAILGAIAGATGHLDMAKLYGSVGGYIASVPASILALKQTLNLHLGSLTSFARNAGT